MERIRGELLEIASRMVNKEIESLRELRKKVVDLDLTRKAPEVDNALFLALYMSKKLTGEVWENLFTDASFEFPEKKLEDFTIWLGEALQGILSYEFESQIIASRLGNLTRWLYDYFFQISLNPGLVNKGGRS